MKKKLGTIFLILLFVFNISIMLNSFNLAIHKRDNDLNDINFNIRTSSWDFANATVISDGIQDIIWNDGMSYYPEIAIDNSGNLHVVWADETNGVWGTDQEIMYTSILIHKAEDKDEISFGFFSIVITSIAILGLIIYIKKKSKL